jgi:hypothetical protein
MPVNDVPMAISSTNHSLDFIAAPGFDVIGAARSRLEPERQFMRAGPAANARSESAV